MCIWGLWTAHSKILGDQELTFAKRNVSVCKLYQGYKSIAKIISYKADFYLEEDCCQASICDQVALFQVNLKRKHWAGSAADQKSHRLQKIFKTQMQNAKLKAQQKETERQELAEAFR